MGLPLAIENIGFFYNTDLVETPPATWEEVREVGAALVDSGDVEVAIGHARPDVQLVPDLHVVSVATSSARTPRASSSPDDIGMTNEGMVEGLTYITSLVDEGLAAENVDWEATHVQFETGASAFIMTGPWAINRFQEAGVPYAIAPFPAAEEGGEAGYPFLGVQGLIVNANSEQLLLAQAFATEKDRHRGLDATDLRGRTAAVGVGVRVRTR